MKRSLNAFDEVLHRVYGAWSRLHGANQPVWCTQLPVLIPHLELLHRTTRHDSTADKHCVPDMHHTKSLNAFDEVLHRVYGAWSRLHGANQPVWCTQLPVLIPHLELLHRTNRHDSTADKHCVPVMHHTKSLNAFNVSRCVDGAQL